MATQHMGRTITSGVMALCLLLLLTPETHSQSVRYKTQTISGNVGAPDVLMQGLIDINSAKVTSDQNGDYTAIVKKGWSGTVTPTKAGYTFEPKVKIYSAVAEDKVGENYTPKEQTFTISGTAGKPDVILRGPANEPNTGPDGRYSFEVRYGESVTITPDKAGFLFEPPSKTIEKVTKSQTVDFTARVQTFTITGNVQAEGVVMNGLPGNPKSSANGDYRAEVPYGFSETVTPTKEGHHFSPSERQYASVADTMANEDYTVTIDSFQISGSVGVAGVTMDGLPGTPTSDADGFYTDTVPFGWKGKVTPSKPGYMFSPTFKEYASVKENQENQTYTADIKRFKIQGTVGVQGAKITGFPEEITSGPGGVYSATVNYDFMADITPEKEGYEFDPPSRTIDAVTKDLTKQDFRAKPITYTISGNAGVGGVQMKGLSGNVTSAADGAYSAIVPHNWDGTVMPIKAGYTFDPPQIVYTDLMESRLTEDYQATPKQYTISGKITTDTGEPLADVPIMVPEKPGANVMTDAEGKFELAVDHGFTGKLTPIMESCAFTPSSKPIGAVVQNLANVNFSAKMRTVTITDKIALSFEAGQPPVPIAGVTITAEPGGATAVTNAQGKFSIKVPWGWSGELTLSKDDMDFNPDRKSYGMRLTEDIDTTAPPKPTATEAGPAPVTTGPGPGTTGPGPVTTGPAPVTTGPGTPPTPVDPLAAERARLEEQLRLLNEKAKGGGMGDLPTVTPGTPITEPGSVGALPPVDAGGPLVTGDFGGDVLDVLATLSRKYSVNINVDMTVKPMMIQSIRLPGTPLGSALQQILTGTPYRARKSRDAENTYEVFRPVTVTSPGDDLSKVLQDISATAGVPIICDDSVILKIYADIQDEVPVEEALEMILSSTSCVAKREKGYYVVGDRRPESPAFVNSSETRRVWLNYIAPERALQLLSKPLQAYAQADLDPNSHLVTVTATTDIAKRIVDELSELDIRPRHVLLDARVVAMERGDLRNLGLKWGMPTGTAGFHANSYLRGTPAGDTAIPNSDWPWGLAVGFSFDQTFTNALTAALNMLEEKSQADVIANPKLVAQDGAMARLGMITEERFAKTAALGQQAITFGYMQTEFETIESGTSLTITPRIADNNDITLDVAVEVSDSIPRGRDSDLPVVTRRTAQNKVTIRDGGTVAVAGLTENRTRQKKSRVPFFADIPLVGPAFRNDDSDKSTREIAVFVTARLVPETAVAAGELPTLPDAGQLMSDDDAFQRELRDGLSR